VPVTVIEMLPEICPQVDADLAKMLRTELGKKNITFHLGAKVLEITADAVRFSKDGAGNFRRRATWSWSPPAACLQRGMELGLEDGARRLRQARHQGG
jgi:NADH dehydrogenase FAD-containing subunit